ncbi:uncharacterized protein LOC133336018 [Musca vetustissima]|uniref:uncharacterized protein LOC133336018 n=1 Tax=Musca vetustissima TaxID=27455 RepID=UPI002AB7DD9D|nr:uncharacterized protein LOC133336018 [Musca vetustissima]
MNLFHLWLLWCFLISLAVNGARAQHNSTTISTLRDPVERVFSRRKRWMLFPKGASLKFTASLSKRLLAIYPKGLNFVLEAALYYPIPGARIDLIPKRFRKPTTKAPKPPGTTPLTLIGIPGSLIKYRAKPATKFPLVQRIDYNVSQLQWLPANGVRPSNAPKWSKYSSPEYLNKYQWSPDKQLHFVEKYTANPNTKWNKWQDKYNYSNRWNRHDRYIRSDETDEIDDIEDNPHYNTYRGRRDLFQHFEGLTKVLGFDMKTCIMRAMCDSKRFLLPPGYSLTHDIMRVLFTFPTISGVKDDYMRIMAADYETCDAHLNNKCPISILDMFLNSKKSI